MSLEINERIREILKASAKFFLSVLKCYREKRWEGCSFTVIGGKNIKSFLGNIFDFQVNEVLQVNEINWLFFFQNKKV